MSAAALRHFLRAERRFRELALAAGARILEWPHPLSGPEGAPLVTSTAFLRGQNPHGLLVVVSGVHGLEGLAGSACQVSLLETFRKIAPPVSILLVHLLNPWGVAWGRRQNEDNVDLNRNFVDFAKVGRPPNAPYLELHPGLLSNAVDAAIESFISRHGRAAFLAALFGGQYSEPQGVNFGGSQPTWSNRTLKAILKRYVTPGRRVAVVDIHTGVGEFGQGTIISTAAAGSAELGRARKWFGERVIGLSESSDDFPYEVQGDLCSGVRSVLLDIEVTAVALEFGTYEIDRLADLQIRDCRRLNGNPERPDLASELLGFFYPADPSWLRLIRTRAAEVFEQAMLELGAS